MKIGLSGINVERNLALIKEVQKLWPQYVSPIKTIYDNDIPTVEDCNEYVQKTAAGLNEAEKDNYLRWNLLYTQYEQYKAQKYIIYCGSPVDLFASALTLKGYGEASDAYIDKTIYYLRRYLKKLDVVYWTPNETGTEELNELDSAIEIIYNGLYNQYRNNFDKSPYFDSKYCAAFIRFNTTNYIEEMKYIIDHKGDLIGGDDNHELQESIEAQKIFKNNPEALHMLIQGEEDRKSGAIEIK